MFASSSIPAAMHSASPRAQLHMMHIQDRLHMNSSSKQCRPLLQCQPDTQDTSATSFNATISHHVEAASGVLPHNEEIVSPTNQVDHSTDRNSVHRCLYASCNHSGIRPVTPRRSSSGRVSTRRLSQRSGSPQHRRSSQGYNVVTLFGFARDPAPAREFHAARTSAQTKPGSQTQPIQRHLQEQQRRQRRVQSPNQLETESGMVNFPEQTAQEVNHQNMQAEVPSSSNVSSSQKSPPTIITGLNNTSSTFVPSIQQSQKSRSGMTCAAASAFQLDSSRIIMSETSAPAENSFYVVLSDPSVSMIISDTDEEEEGV